MPWKGSLMSQRLEFVHAASREDANIRQLCATYGISPDTAYRWLRRCRVGGPEALAERSRKPHRSPTRTKPELEQCVLKLRDEHPAWGGRKLRARLMAIGRTHVPAASTVTAILQRHGRISPEESAKHKPWTRFEAPAPNDLWQMDFKGWFLLQNRQRCHPLSVLDDHSRYGLGLFACSNQETPTVREKLTTIFQRVGLPAAFLMDNGSCWGGHPGAPYTALTVWLLQLGVAVRHGRPRHPQTQGKDERFHRTIKAEVLRAPLPAHAAAAQQAFDRWLPIYNHQRPHEALGLAVPASRYRPSARPFPRTLQPLEYPAGMLVRKVQANGLFHFNKRLFFLGTAFRGQPIALQPTHTDGTWDILFGTFTLARITQADFQNRRVAVVRPLRYNRLSAGETEAGSAGEQPAEG